MASRTLTHALAIDETVELIEIPTTIDCEQCGEETDPRDMVGAVCWECAE